MPLSQFSPSSLRDKVGDFARGHRYNVVIDNPSRISGLSSTVNNNLQFLCESVSLPTRSLASNAQDIYGPPREIPYRTTFTEAAMSFILDDNMAVKEYFDTWQEYIVNEETWNPRYWDNYVTQITIHRLKNTATSLAGPDNIAYTVLLREAYPSVIGEIALGHTGGGEVLRLPVTFKYRSWTRNLTARGQAPITGPHG